LQGRCFTASLSDRLIEQALGEPSLDWDALFDWRGAISAFAPVK
jgi:hypothetical protein